MIATMPGATSNCGKRTSASSGKLAALDRAAQHRRAIAAITRAITSR